MDYPKDRQNCGFAIQYIKWLCNSGVVRECGPDAFALLVAVVTMEDEIFYSRAPNFYNDQLANRCGIGSEPALIRARTRAVRAGLLYYEAGAKRRPGRYFVTGLNNDPALIPSAFTNESLAKEPIPSAFPTDSLRIRKRNVSESAALHTLLPHTPNPTISPERDLCDDVVACWNASGATTKVKTLTVERRRKLQTRLKNPSCHGEKRSIVCRFQTRQRSSGNQTLIGCSLTTPMRPSLPKVPTTRTVTPMVHR